ncbi:hypothetical protein TVAG_102490 [Trichomonas vaginalis G3]|uniref:Uncharacterized protein n=1 Tax=Trichomonas vaginalis (strain ATCC PRA-98 / G3) TaxID=412133 RepID=A2ECV5_TRIV3|nr:hypothetical protein TVAGG3_0564070 [Trichomonas vaginalis G3]EAY09500.1 hypothetical protein TVAG_102490 [Trichomonas vaginalis G3]KAI5521431.1 hypothetical protein TVAGG3_0564070 [Trichomonas vaginalis G3]|eukprot:XP_001321723.1 hypothetical protein [Trichomonas vaginalis G3]
MTESLSATDIDLIRKALVNTKTLTEKEIGNILGRETKSLKSKITKFRPQLLDQSISSQSIAESINKILSKKPNQAPPKLELPEDPAIVAILPPKMRAKVPMLKTPTEKVPGLDKTPLQLSNNRSFSSDFGVQPRKLIPIYPKTTDDPVMPSPAHTRNPDPEIGSLAVVVHKLLGPAHICRILSSKMENGTKHYLIAFFQRGLEPGYVPGDYLYQLHTHVGFPLGDESEWKDAIENQNCSVDWLLEHIYSAAQNLVIKYSEFQLPSTQLSKNEIKPDPNQTQQILFLSVSFAALLLLCYIASRYKIPESKIQIILDIIIKTNPTKYQSTKTIINDISNSLKTILALPK